MKKSVRWIAAMVAASLSSSSVLAAEAGTPVARPQITQDSSVRAAVTTGPQDDLFGAGIAIPLLLGAAVLAGLGAYIAGKGKPNRPASP